MSQKTINNCLKFSLGLIFMLGCLTGKSQYDFSAVDKLLTNNQKLLGNNLAAVIYKDGKIIYQKELGEFTVKTKAPIASCSKWLTAALAMTFVDEGKLSLDDKVSDYIPLFSSYSKNYITIRHCLSHQTGIQDNPKLLAKMLERRKFESLEEEVNSFAKKEIDTNPGTSFSYNNMGLNIVGRILEIISKKKFDALMKQRIFTPLNMKGSTFIGEYDDAVNPSGGAISTALDYTNFMTMILDKGMFMGKRVLSEASIKEMQTVQTANVPKKYVPKVAEGFDYGLGEWIQETGTNGTAKVVASPGLFGTWPYVDNCRKYTCIFFVKTILGEQKKDLYLQLQKAIEAQIPSCQ